MAEKKKKKDTLVDFLLNSWFPNLFESWYSSIALTLLNLFSRHLPLSCGPPFSLAFLLVFPDDGLISFFSEKIKAFRHYFQIMEMSSFPSFLFRGRNSLFSLRLFALPDLFTSTLPLDVTCDVLSSAGWVTFYLFSEKAFINNHGFKEQSMFTF